jgi:hypothetical protein
MGRKLMKKTCRLGTDEYIEEEEKEEKMEEEEREGRGKRIV